MKEFSSKVKCIYIDPPYNNGEEYAHYSDVFSHEQWLNNMREILERLFRLLSKITQIEDEYRKLLAALLPIIKSDDVVEALDEIQLFWLRHIEIVQLYLYTTFGGPESYAFTAATYLDYDANEHIPFLLLGNLHILDDPLNGYADMAKVAEKGIFSERLI